MTIFMDECKVQPQLQNTSDQYVYKWDHEYLWSETVSPELISWL